ncbi:alpha/beta hydrolase [Aliikangiella maris]|uniref:Dienelactone hydrolase family protein n=2 Tax=Aliikangiella maris TaxID=3162458 RepID=A0ABV2BU40_9GAMM
MNLLPHIEVNPQVAATASVIWLHGLGADGNDFKSIVPELNLPEDLAVRFIFPHAPSIPVTINAGYVMPAWYDILQMDVERQVDEIQLRNSAKQIEKFIEHEISRGISANKIIIAGFSQGGAVAYETVLAFPQKLAGLLAMSTYFATKDSVVFNSANQMTPIAIQHGTQDPVVPAMLGEQAYLLLKEKEYPVNFQSYPMEHSVCMQQIGDISLWIQQVLNDN